MLVLDLVSSVRKVGGDIVDVITRDAVDHGSVLVYFSWFEGMTGF